MADSIAPGGDGQANHVMSLIRQEVREGPIGTETVLTPGLVLRADPALEVGGTWRSPEGVALEIEATAGGAGGWFGLHLSVPVGSLAGCGVIGYAARFRAPETLVARACLRSGQGEGFADCFFDKHLLMHDEAYTQLDALTIRDRDELPERADWRELILFLPPRALRLTLDDLRVFAV